MILDISFTTGAALLQMADPECHDCCAFGEDASRGNAAWNRVSGIGSESGQPKNRKRMTPTSRRGWLPDMDLNHDKQIQSLLCYRYTIGQSIGGRR